MTVLSSVNQGHVLSPSFQRGTKLWVQQSMSSVRIYFLSVHNCLFLPGRTGTVALRWTDQTGCLSVYLCESGLQNQIAVVTDFCMSEVALLPCAPGCSSVMLDVAPWYFQKPNLCQGHSHSFAALHKAWSSYFHKTLTVFSASPFGKAPNLPILLLLYSAVCCADNS